MKTILYTVCLLISISSFCQDFKYFDFKYKIDWSQFETDTVTENILKSNYEVLKGNPYFDLDSIIKSSKKYHFLDIDNDGVDELIYNGWNGGEGEMVVIYQLVDDKYSKVQSFFGKICDIRKTKSNTTRLIVFDYACCAGYVDHVETFDYNSVTKKFGITNSIAKIYETSLPDKWIKAVKFEIINTPYNLRYSPTIETGLKNDSYPFDPINGQNITSIYKAGDRGTAYAEHTDNTGRVWWFVVMDSKPESGESLYYEGNNEFNEYKPIGWISSRFVKIIE